MPLEILAIMVPVGIALIVLAVRYSGLSKKAQLRGGEEAGEVFLKDFAGEDITGQIIIANNQRAAFIEMKEASQLGLVEAMGDRFITRLLRGSDVASINKQDENIITIKFHDFTHPTGTYGFETLAQMSKVDRWLDDMKAST